MHAAEVDLGVLEQCAEDERGFGGIRAVRVPLPICSAVVDSAYPRRLPEIGCVNPEFYEPPGGGTFEITLREQPSRDA